MRTRGHDSPIGLVATLAMLLTSGALLPAPLAAQGDPPPRRMKVIRSDTAFIRSDSTIVRVTIDADQIEQTIRDLVASKAMEQTIGESLRAAASGQAVDSKKIRELSEALGRIAQKNAALITTIEMSCAGDRQPEGYIGVQFSELQTVMGGDAPQAAPLRDYPRIDSVYPGSPASKAGLRRGDVVLLMGGQDARRAVQLDKLLRPMATLPMRVQRDGAQKDYTIVVERRPADFNSECANVDQVIGPEFDQPMLFMRSRLGQRTPFPPSVLPRSQTPPAAPDAPTSPVPAMPPVAGFMYGFSTTSSVIAGASLMQLTDDWRATLGVDNGVLVTRVLPGTPSKDSGLHDGDVIISADGQTVASVRALARIVSNARARVVKLQVVRAGKPQVIMLRWHEPSPDD